VCNLQVFALEDPVPGGAAKEESDEEICNPAARPLLSSQTLTHLTTLAKGSSQFKFTESSSTSKLELLALVSKPYFDTEVSSLAKESPGVTLPTLLDTLGSDFLSSSYAVFTALVTFWESPSRTKLPQANCESLVRCWKHVSWAEELRFMISHSLQLINESSTMRFILELFNDVTPRSGRLEVVLQHYNKQF